ncbi:MAG: ATP-binding protein [Betaproteobacteria bacterium]|nr:ATP-binding protein [Betaproteobacteria bacterium]
MSQNSPRLSAQDLEQAFSLFNETSLQLAGAYQDLQAQVARLTQELAVANSELRRQLEEKDALSRRLARLLEVLPGGVLVLDPAGCVAEANPVAKALFGEAVAGRAWDAVMGERLQGTETPSEYVLAAAGEDGARRLNIGDAAWDDGGTVLLVQDITASHRLSEQLERHQRLSSMGQMAASLAHQLRTPLATALLYTANLAKPQRLLDAERIRFAEKALDRLRHLERLIQDMLLFVRGESAGAEPISMVSLLSELAQTIEPQMSQRGVMLEVEDQSAGAAIVGARKAIVGALLNILENALQASGPGGSVRLRARADDGQVTLSILDTGCGIAPEHRARLFEPFFTTRADGTGLGLAIVRGVISAHGGEVEALSPSGGGAEFVIRLPRFEARAGSPRRF